MVQLEGAGGLMCGVHNGKEKSEQIQDCMRACVFCWGLNLVPLMYSLLFINLFFERVSPGH